MALFNCGSSLTCPISSRIALLILHSIIGLIVLACRASWTTVHILLQLSVRAEALGPETLVFVLINACSRACCATYFTDGTAETINRRYHKCPGHRVSSTPT